MAIELNVNESYKFGDLTIIPFIGEDNEKLFKIYAENSILIHPVSDNTVVLLNQRQIKTYQKK